MHSAKCVGEPRHPNASFSYSTHPLWLYHKSDLTRHAILRNFLHKVMPLFQYFLMLFIALFQFCNITEDIGVHVAFFFRTGIVALFQTTDD